MKDLDETLIPRTVNGQNQNGGRNGGRNGGQPARMQGLRRANRPDPADLPLHAAVLAFDPGETTGWSLLVALPEGLSSIEEHAKYGVLKNISDWKHGQIDCGNQKGNGSFHYHSTSGEAAGVNEIVGLIRAWPGAAIVFEDFIIDPRRLTQTRDLLSPVRVTSAVSFYLWLQRRGYFVQSASLAKTTVPDERLRSWGFYDKYGGLGHARDADRHGLTFLKRAAQKDAKGRELRKTAWPYLFDKGGEFYDPGVNVNGRPLQNNRARGTQ